MKVKDLINQLKNFDQNSEVYFANEFSNWPVNFAVNGVETSESVSSRHIYDNYVKLFKVDETTLNKKDCVILCANIQ